MRAWARTRRWLVAGAALVVAAGVPVFSAGTAQAAEGQVHKPADAKVIEGRYIVSLKARPGLAAAASASSLAGKYGGKVERTYQAALTGFTLSASEEQAKRLAADPNVDRVEADALMRTTGTQTTPPWNLDRVDQRSTVLDDTYTYPDGAGAGVTAYIMDTGVRTSHAEFEGRASVGFDAIGDGWNGQDCSTFGHGTHVAGTVGGATYGVAKKVKLVSVRVLSCENVGATSQIIAGVDWITQHAQRPAVVNMSLGGGKSAAQELAVKNSIAAGLTYVVSAGNDDRDACNASPAALPEAITVGASNPVDERARDWKDPGSSIVNASNYGPCLDLFAPGEAIKSAHNATDTATVILRGTSMASPHVAGAAALLLSQSPNLTPAEVTNALLGRATVGVLKQDTLKTGSPNKMLYTGVPPQMVCSGANDSRQSIPDLGSVTSTIELTACPRKVASTAKVRVRAEHPARGDLSVRLVAPDGSERVLKEADGADGTANLDQTYPLTDMSTKDANGVWKLVVRDNFGFDEGALVGWNLVLAEPAVALPVVSSAVYPADNQPHGGVGVGGTFVFKPGSSVPVAKYSYQLDGEAQPKEVTATNGEASVTITPNTAGRRTLTVRAFNAVGEPSAPVPYDFVVADVPPPAAPVVSSYDYPADGRPSGGAGLTGAFTFKPGSAQAVKKYSYQLDTDAQPAEVAGTGEVSVALTPNAAGRRTLTVRAIDGGAPSAPTTYTFTVASATDLLDGGTLVADGAAVTQTIPVDKALRLRFDGTAGDKLGLGIPSNAVTTFAKVWVVDPAGRSFTVENNNGPSYTGPATSRYIPIPALKTTGSYQVFIDPDAAGTGAVTVQLAKSLVGTTDPAAQGFPYSMARSGQSVDLSFDAAQNTWYDLGVTDQPSTQYLTVHVFDQNGARIGNPLVLYPGSPVRFRAAAPGRYRAVVGAYFGESTGGGKLWLSTEADAGDITASGPAKALTLSRPGQYARLRFDGTAGQRLGVAFTDLSWQFGFPRADVLGPDGVSLGAETYGGGAIVPALKQTGAHELVVNSGGADTGTLKATLSEEIVAGPIAVGGAAKPITVGRVGQHTRLRFDGTAGQRLSLGVTNATAGFDSHFVRVYQPDGTMLSYGTYTTGADRYAFEVLPVTGAYEILVSPTKNVTGTVTLTLSAPADAGTIAVGGAATVSVPRAGQEGQVAFTGVAGDKLRLTFSGSTFANKVFTLTVLKPDGTKLVDRAYKPDLNPYDLPALPAAGSYVVLIDPDAAGTGSLSVGLVRSP
ncbi:S8 family serine peptidase [Amycolatopsis sp. NPDC059021]|uniref:S8 family serine peptidase n=1 Tax=Amycolatopsis sp. NPDC059021 TaxID=3346704 RepID=UPI00367097FE